MSLHVASKRGNRVLWIDVARGIAIIAVVFEHVVTIRGQFLIPLLDSHAEFCVSWFFFLAGITSVLSTPIASSGLSLTTYLTYWKKRLPIVGLYLIASIITSFWIGFTGLRPLFWNIILFSTSEPYYFFFTLFQLYLLFPLFSEILKKIKSTLGFIFIFACITSIWWYFSLFSNYPWYYAPWKMPLAGTFAPIFFLGAAYGRWYKRINQYALILGVIIFLSLESVLIYTHGDLFTSNTSVALFSWSLSLLFVVKTIIEYLPKLTLIWRVLAFLGKHSLVIFLFHYPTILTFATYRPESTIVFSILILLATSFPLLIEYVFNAGRLLFWNKGPKTYSGLNEAR